MRYCSNCGARLEDKANFCNRCGTPVHEIHYTNMPSEKEKTYKDRLFDAMKASGEERRWEENHPNNRFGIISIILVIVGVIALGIILS